MKSPLYSRLREFKRRYPWTICWRLKSHSKIVDMHLNPGEVVRYAFAAQKNNKTFDIISTYVVVLTNKRILLGQKRLLFGYFYTAITPDMFSDLNISMGILWGKVYIDTVKEEVVLSKIQRNALPEIETEITEYMMREKKKYLKPEESN
ncbi:MAG: PH domain-containing protein [Bacilli bacterium]|nr:PH domain-containing protein [Bacilli bacterium]